MLSPEFSQEKLSQSLILIANKLADKLSFQTKIKHDTQRNFLVQRVQAICSLGISRVIIRDEQQILDHFRSNRKYLLARHQRDFPRLVCLIKGIALLNAFNRERDAETSVIYANSEDIKNGIELYESIAQSNELGIQPEALEIYKRIIFPCYQESDGIARKEIARLYWEEYHERISDRKLREEILPALESAALIYQEADPSDKRKYLVYPSYFPKQNETQDNPVEDVEAHHSQARDQGSTGSKVVSEAGSEKLSEVR